MAPRPGGVVIECNEGVIDASFGSLWDVWREKNAGVWKGPLPLTYPPAVNRVGADNPLRRPALVTCCANRRAQHRRRMDEKFYLEADDCHSRRQRKANTQPAEADERTIHTPIARKSTRRISSHK